MRSPWQVLKGFASRSKADGSPGQPDEAEDGRGSTPEAPSANEKASRQNSTGPSGSDADTVSIRVSIAAEEPKAPVQKQRATEDNSSQPPQATLSSGPDDAPIPQLVEVMALPTTEAPAPLEGGEPLRNHADGKQSTQSGKKANKIAFVDHDAGHSDEIAVVDQATALETEINMLRARLSEKLHEQNTYLRRLLERYE